MEPLTGVRGGTEMETKRFASLPRDGIQERENISLTARGSTMVPTIMADLSFSLPLNVPSGAFGGTPTLHIKRRTGAAHATRPDQSMSCLQLR